ncbi:class I SAM-dependent methyltransferase, partial [Georgenia ruanii]|nr:class I SAM-dependent methyltransferase [Georgenia ruanii]
RPRQGPARRRAPRRGRASRRPARRRHGRRPARRRHGRRPAPRRRPHPRDRAPRGRRRTAAAP